MSLISMSTHHEFRPVPLQRAALAFLAERHLFLKGLFPAARKTPAPDGATDAAPSSNAPGRTCHLIV